MNNRATPHSADEGAETKVLAHVRGLKSVLPQLCSSMQPRSDHQRCSSDHPMQSKQTPTAARRSAGVGAGALAWAVGWTTSWPAWLLLPGSENSGPWLNPHIPSCHQHHTGCDSAGAPANMVLCSRTARNYRLWSVCWRVNKPVLIR